MFFRFELYPADLLNVINGKSDEDAGRIIRQWVIGLIGNNTECIQDDSAKALAEKMLGRCQEKSDIYRNNRKKAIGKKYASDAGAIRSWVADKVLKEEQGARSFKSMERKRDAESASSMLTDEQRKYYGV